MEKKLTSNLLLFSSLTVILYTTAKASEHGKLFEGIFSTTIGHKVTPAEFEVSRHKATLAEFEASRHRVALAKFEEKITRFQEQHEKDRQQRAQEKTVGKLSLPKVSLLKQFSPYFNTQNDFHIKGFDEKD